MEHLPECPRRGDDSGYYCCAFCDGYECICDQLRACEKRVLDAAREAVDALPKMKIAGNFPLCDIDEVLAAIDALYND